MSQPDLPDSNASARDTPTSIPEPVLTGAKMDASPPYTPQDWLMFALGTLLGLASIVLFLLGTAVLAVIFFINKPPRSPFLRGIGLGIAIVAVVIAGALTLCFVGLGMSSFGNYGVRR